MFTNLVLITPPCVEAAEKITLVSMRPAAAAISSFPDSAGGAAWLSARLQGSAWLQRACLEGNLCLCYTQGNAILTGGDCT